MAKKIKIRIQTENKHINLPKMRLSHLVWLVRFGLWTTRYNDSVDEETRASIKANRKEIIKIIKMVIKELKPVKPFTLVEVESKDANILIDIL
jgi:hypothetical protein